MCHRQTGSATRIEDLCWQLEVSDATFIRQIVNPEPVVRVETFPL